MIEYNNNQQPKKPFKYKKPLIIAAVLLAIVLAGGLLYFWWRADANLPEPEPLPQQLEQQITNKSQKEPTKPKAQATSDFSGAKLQAALSEWADNHTGTYAVTITDESGKVLAEHDADKVFFAASLYKLYVAYEGYRKVDDGTYKLSQTYLNGWTREKCLHEMIHSSNSPCAEKMMAELGPTTLNTKVKTYGMNNTSLSGISTSSRDSALMLSRIWQGTGLSESSKAKYLKSLETQIYAEGLKTGFDDQTVYDKVGFRENIEYHDAGIVKFSDGRVLIVSVFTKNVGTKNIVGLAQSLLAATKKL
mgnify:CR=1 FL=1